MRARHDPSTCFAPGEPHLRLAAGLAGLVLASIGVRRDRVSRGERRLFIAVNHLPDSLARPLWVVMQGGNFAAGPTTAALAWLSGRPALARRLLVAGSASWVLVKVVKRGIERPRPGVLVMDTKYRGREQSGLGFVSGHAAVVASLCAAALPELGPPARRAAIAVAVTVGVARLYIGAHLPLDVLGGVALGIAVEAAVELAEDRTSVSSVGP